MTKLPVHDECRSCKSPLPADDIQAQSHELCKQCRDEYIRGLARALGRRAR